MWFFHFSEARGVSNGVLCVQFYERRAVPQEADLGSVSLTITDTAACSPFTVIAYIMH